MFVIQRKRRGETFTTTIPMPEQNPYAPPQAQVADIDQLASGENAPALWNPNAAASWSLIFTPIFGAYLHMRNWEALGQPEKAARSKNWMIGSIVCALLFVTVPLFLPESKGVDALGRAFGFALLITWYYAIGKSQQAFVLGKFGKAYPRRGWSKPLLAAVGALIALFVVVFVGTLVVTMGSR
jgi:hypothetical protein